MKATVSSSRGFYRVSSTSRVKRSASNNSRLNGRCNVFVRGSLDRNYKPVRTHRSCNSLNLLLPNLEKPKVIKPMKPWMKGAIEEERKAIRKDRYNRSKMDA